MSVTYSACANSTWAVGFCMVRLVGIIQLLLIGCDGVQEVHCVLEKDASASPSGHVQE